MSTPGAATNAELLAVARKVADAVLYEGYVLYPYRASSSKNQVRWQWGVVAPRGWSEAGGCEEWWAQTECLIEPEADCRLIGKVRFLQVRRRRIEEVDGEGCFRPVGSLEVEGKLLTAWEEGIEREIDFDIKLRDLLPDETTHRFTYPENTAIEEVRIASAKLAARVVREELAIAGDLRLAAEKKEAVSPVVKLRLRVENVTPADGIGAERENALPAFFVGVHTLLSLRDGKFLSLADPPEWARELADSCKNQRAWPVLIGEHGERNVVLASPIILEDHPQIAPESPGELCDSTEIDEILTLRTMTLTDEEKREARATDARAAAIIDRVDNMPPEMLEKLHGTIRYLRGATGERDEASAPGGSASEVPWWDPAGDPTVDPETDAIEVRGVRIAKGSRVRLCPGSHGSDAQDMFLVGKTATVEGVFIDVEDKHYLAVTLEDDPAAELHQWHGRFFYFAPDEVQPLSKEACE